MSIFSSISHVVSSAAHTVASGVKTATHYTNEGINHVVESLDPQLQSLKSTYANLTGQYNTLRNEVQQDIQQYTKTDERYKMYAGLTCSLMLVSVLANMPEDQFNDFLEQTTEPPADLKPSNYLPTEVAKLIKSSTGPFATHLINGIYKFKDLEKKGLLNSPLSISMNLQMSLVNALSEALGLGSFTNSATGELLSSTIGFINAFNPANIIINIVNETKEYESANNKLHHQISQLQNDATQVLSTIQQLDRGVAKTKSAFLGIMQKLNAIAPANFNWQLSLEDKDAVWQAAIQAAVTQYAVIGQIRLSWKRYHHRHPNGTKEEFKDLVNTLMTRKFTASQLDQFVDFVLAEVA